MTLIVVSHLNLHPYMGELCFGHPGHAFEEYIDLYMDLYQSLDRLHVGIYWTI